MYKSFVNTFRKLCAFGTIIYLIQNENTQYI